MRRSIAALFCMLIATAAASFPTKVKVLKEPNLASSEGTEVVLITNKGSVTASYRHPAYDALANAKKGQCLNLETDSESNILFNKKLDGSGVSSVFKVRC